jgi:hypothetical protein
MKKYIETNKSILKEIKEKSQLKSKKSFSLL